MKPITFDLRDCPCLHDEYTRFLEWVPTQLPPDAFILECGTWSGSGARALGRLGHRLETYDPWPRDDLQLPPNAKHFPLSIFDIPDAHLLTPDLIYLDIDPHAGPPETKFYEKLKAIGYRGVMLCDDISMNDGMKTFWDAVDLPKYGTQQRGHLTGMGFILFSPEHTVIPLE